MKLFVFLSRLCAGGSLAKRSTLFLGASAAAVVLGSAARARKSYGVRPSFRPVENRSPLLSERGLRFRRRSASEEQTHFSGEKGKEFWPRGRDGWPDTHSDGRPKHSSGRPEMGSFRRRRHAYAHAPRENICHVSRRQFIQSHRIEHMGEEEEEEADSLDTNYCPGSGH